MYWPVKCALESEDNSIHFILHLPANACKDLSRGQTLKECRITLTKKFSYLYNVLMPNNTSSATSFLLIHI